MKKQGTILIKLRILCRAACWCALVVALTLACGAAMAELIPITLKHDWAVSSVAFSPDGNLLATGTWKAAKVWEMPSGNLITTLKHDNKVWSVAFSPDGKLLATGSGDNTAKVWEMPTGNLIATMKHDNTDWFVAFSPDGKLMTTGDGDNTARVWAPVYRTIRLLK